MKNSFFSEKTLVVCSDSKKLVDDFEDFVVLGLSNSQLGQSLSPKWCDLTGIQVYFIQRGLNKEVFHIQRN